jgi:DNA polymerase-3 subunit epsilon
MHVDQMLLDRCAVTIIDFETTGLSAKSGDRVIEVGVVRMEPNEPPKVVIDTLVDPQCRVGATDIHGISTEDVLGAPPMSELIGPIAHASVDSLVLAYNASFDMAFLRCEADQVPRLRPFDLPPYACLMYLRPALGVGRRASLEAALREVDVRYEGHHAASDALAAAAVWSKVRDAALNAGHRRWHEIPGINRFKFTESWRQPVMSQRFAELIGTPDHPTAAKQRPGSRSLVPQERSLRRAEHRRARYRTGLMDAFADRHFGVDDVTSLRMLASDSGLTRGEIRAVHASFFADVLREIVSDGFVSHDENDRVQHVAEALRELGWTPGDESLPT